MTSTPHTTRPPAPPAAGAASPVSASPGGTAAAAAAVWDWRRERRPIPEGPTAGARRKRAALQTLVGAAIGGLVFLRSPALAAVVWTIAAATLVLALVSPGRGYAALERGLARFGRAVGQVLAVVLLVPLFFGFFTLFGLLARRGRRDRLERSFDPAAPSYWKRREWPERTLGDYERMS